MEGFRADEACALPGAEHSLKMGEQVGGIFEENQIKPEWNSGIEGFPIEVAGTENKGPWQIYETARVEAATGTLMRRKECEIGALLVQGARFRVCTFADAGSLTQDSSESAAQSVAGGVGRECKASLRP
jgi:hypothetical protein